MIKSSCSPSSPREDSDREGGFQRLYSNRPMPTSYVTCPSNARELARSLWPGKKRARQTQKQSGREEEGAERPNGASAHQPPYPKSGEAGTGTQLPVPAQDRDRRPLVAEKQVFLRFSRRIGTLLEAKGAGLKYRKVRRKCRKVSKVAGRPQPEGVSKTRKTTDFTSKR